MLKRRPAVKKSKITLAKVIFQLTAIGMLVAACTTPTAQPPQDQPTAIPQQTEVPAPTAQTGPQVGGTVHVISGAGYFSMDAGTRPDSDTLSVRYNIYDSLVTWNKDWEIVPQVATSWESSEDGLTWTFHLRDDVKFHDGTPLNAAAVKWSMERQLDPEGPYVGSNPVRNQGLVESIEAPDEWTVVIKTSAPAPLLLNTLAHGDAQIVSPTAVETWGADAENHSLGSGPYKFLSWIRGGELILERNADYWLACGEGGPCFDRIVYRVVPEESARTTLLLTGEAELVNRIPPHDAAVIDAAQANATLVRTDAPRTIAMRLNKLHSPFDNHEARLAMQYAVDKQGIIDSVLSGAGVIASSAQPGVTNFWQDQGAYPFDAAKARQMLEAIDFDFDHEFKMVCPQGRFVRDSQICEAVQGQLAQNLGLNIELEIIADFPAYLAALDEGSGYYWDMALDGVYSANPDPDSMIECAFNPSRAGHICNFDGFVNDRFGEVLNAAMTTMDQTARASHYAEMQEILWAEVPWLYLFYEVSFDGISNKLENAYILPMQRAVIREAWFADR
jgi:peptide/nickel transport system substrate-binding protein